MGEIKKYVQNLVGNFKDEDSLGKRGIVGWILLKRILNTVCFQMWTDFDWFRINSGVL